MTEQFKKKELNLTVIKTLLEKYGFTELDDKVFSPIDSEDFEIINGDLSY